MAVPKSLGADHRVELADVRPRAGPVGRAAAGLPADRLAPAIDTALKVLRTDGRKMLRILTNLLENANKHSPAGARRGPLSG